MLPHLMLTTLQALEKEYQLRVHYQIVATNLQAYVPKLLAQNAELKERLSKIQVCFKEGEELGVCPTF